MKLLLSDIGYLKKSIDVINGLVIEARFNINKEGISLLSMDPAGVCFIYFKLLKSAFTSYELDKDLELCLKLIDLKMVLKKSSEDSVLIIEYEEPRLLLTLKGKSRKEFKINTIDLEDKEYKEPTLQFDCVIKTKSDVIQDAIDTCDIIKEGGSVTITANSQKLIFYSEDMNNEVSHTIKVDSDTEIKTDKEVISKFSIDYLKKVIEGIKLSDNLKIEMSNNYPIKFDYIIPDKVHLWLLIAPRVDKDD